jgi:cytoskeletal protein CcmA (bactofilin family)
MSPASFRTAPPRGGSKHNVAESRARVNKQYYDDGKKWRVAMKRLLLRLAALSVLVVPVAALAYGAQSGQTTTVPKGTTKTGTFYAAGQTVTIAGDIDGDLICAGQNVEVSGAVHGDVICAGQNVAVNGPVDGSVRLAGQNLSIKGTVGRNVTVAGQAFTLDSPATVAGDLGVTAQAATINGPVAKTVYGVASNLTLDNSVGSVDARVPGNLTLGDNASVQGNLAYSSDNAYNIDKAKVHGQVQHSALPAHERQAPMKSAGSFLAGWFGWLLYWLVAALVTGLVLVWLAPRLVHRVNRTLLDRPGQSVLWGLAVTILAPVVIILLMVTIIGIPVGLLLAALWVLALATSGLFAGIAVGEWITHRTNWQSGSLLVAAAVGIVATVIVFNIPVIGWLVALVATWWAVGGLVLSARPARG